MTVLIIDDDPALRDSVRRTLRKERYTVLEATDGREGIKIATANPVDLILIDLFMPGKEGLETIAELHRAYPALKVIAMSGGGTKGFVDLLDVAKSMGAQRVLAKPFSREELLGTVEALLGNSHVSSSARGSTPT